MDALVAGTIDTDPLIAFCPRVGSLAPIASVEIVFRISRTIATSGSNVVLEPSTDRLRKSPVAVKNGKVDRAIVR